MPFFIKGSASAYPFICHNFGRIEIKNRAPCKIVCYVFHISNFIGFFRQLSYHIGHIYPTLSIIKSDIFDVFPRNDKKRIFESWLFPSNSQKSLIYRLSSTPTFLFLLSIQHTPHGLCILF